MSVDIINNAFNSIEDKIQHALGLMDAYLVQAEVIPDPSTIHCGYYTATTNSSSPVPIDNFFGIIALNHAEALIKFLKHYPTYAQSHSLKVITICE